MLLDSAPVETVAEQLHLSVQTVRRYKAIVAEGGLDALSKMGVGGRASALDREALEWIAGSCGVPRTSTASKAMHGPTRGCAR